MSTSVLILLIIASSSIIAHGRTLRSPDQLIPLLLSSAVGDDSNTNIPTLQGQNQLLDVVGHIIKYVSKIKSSENFIDNIINRQKQVSDKIKLLRFLNNCFQVTNTVIQREIHHMTHASNKNSSTSSPFTVEELQEAQDKIHDLLDVIKERIAGLKTWVPPTMPFLGF